MSYVAVKVKKSEIQKAVCDSVEITDSQHIMVYEEMQKMCITNSWVISRNVCRNAFGL